MRVFIVGVLFFTALHTQAASSPYDLHLHVYPNEDQFQIIADYKAQQQRSEWNQIDFIL